MNKIVTFEAHVKWAKIFEDNRDLGNDDTEKGQKIQRAEGMYVIDCYPTDPDGLKHKLEQLNVNMSPLGHDIFRVDDGKEYLKPQRYHTGAFPEMCGAPKVVDADGDPWDSDKKLGNGSLCQIAVELWKPKTAKKYYLRLKAVKVLEMVEFESSVDPEVEWAI